MLWLRQNCSNVSFVGEENVRLCKRRENVRSVNLYANICKNICNINQMSSDIQKYCLLKKMSNAVKMNHIYKVGYECR